MQKVVFYTQHPANQTITQFFAKSQNLMYENVSNYQKYQNINFVSYGILRGTGEIFQNTENFFYIDHGYLNSSKRKFNNNDIIIEGFTGYFRIVKNNFYFNKDFKNKDKKRFEKLNISLKELNNNGEYIVLSEPSRHIINFLGIHDWTENTVNKIKSLTDREIIIHNKFSEISLNDVLKKAYAFVSCQSTAAFKAIAEGIPAYFTHRSLNDFGNLNDIDNRYLNHDLLYLAANSQWKLKEFFGDEFKEFLNSLE
tara:strand:+ start:2955 stop:3716 length:762 start_codon:yes stop_codon:yes gene_type:complete